MPHCILEYSDNIKDITQWNDLFIQLHKVLLDTGEFKKEDIKSRVLEYKNYYIGDGSPNQAFITLNIQILDGRSDKFKKELAQSALNVLNKFFYNTLERMQTSITVQISDIHRRSYSKSTS